VFWSGDWCNWWYWQSLCCWIFPTWLECRPDQSFFRKTSSCCNGDWCVNSLSSFTMLVMYSGRFKASLATDLEGLWACYSIMSASKGGTCVISVHWFYVNRPHCALLNLLQFWHAYLAFVFYRMLSFCRLFLAIIVTGACSFLCLCHARMSGWGIVYSTFNL